MRQGFKKAYYLNDILEYNLPKDIARQQTKILKDISLNEVHSLAKSKLKNSDEYIILLVGDKSQLSAKTQSQYEIIYLDKEGNPLK